MNILRIIGCVLSIGFVIAFFIKYSLKVDKKK